MNGARGMPISPPRWRGSIPHTVRRWPRVKFTISTIQITDTSKRTGRSFSLKISIWNSRLFQTNSSSRRSPTWQEMSESGNAHLERCTLRPGNVHSADGWRDVREPVVARQRDRKLRRLFGADATFASPDSYEYVEAEDASPHFSVRPEGADHQWRKVPSRELSVDLVADERGGWVTGRLEAS